MSTQLKFDGPRLDEVLERIGRELGPQAVIVEANRGRRGGVGGFFAREWFEVVVEAPPPPDEAEEAAEPAEGRSLMSDEALLRLADGVSDEVVPVSASVPVPAAAEERQDAFSKVLARVGGAATSRDARADVHTRQPTPAVAAGPIAPQVASPQAQPRTLKDLDLATMLSVLDRTAPRVSTALDTGAGAIVAVVGDLSAARPVAEAVAARAGLQEDDVLVASPNARDDVPSWLRVDGAATAAARVDRWRRRERPVVVAVDLTPGRDGHVWAAEVLAAMGADEVRLVARAWQVTDELGPKAAVLGGIDGLELVDVEAAGEPEAFLDLELPVLGIDGRAATPELWAALLIERRNDVAL